MDNTQGENANRSTAARLQDVEKRLVMLEEAATHEINAIRKHCEQLQEGMNHHEKWFGAVDEWQSQREAVINEACDHLGYARPDHVQAAISSHYALRMWDGEKEVDIQPVESEVKPEFFNYSGYLSEEAREAYLNQLSDAKSTLEMLDLVDSWCSWAWNAGYADGESRWKNVAESRAKDVEALTMELQAYRKVENPPAHARSGIQESASEVDPGGGDMEGGSPLANSGTLETPYSQEVVSHLDHILEQLDAGHVAYCRGKLRDLRRKLGGAA